MKKKSLLFLSLVFSSLFISLQAQKYIPNSSITGVCYAGKTTNRIYIPPPDEFFKKGDTKSGGSIKVYYTDFTDDAKIAMEYAVSILETMLPADTKLTVIANWQDISTEGTLGNSSVTAYVAGWAIDALNPWAYYGVGLAEKIAGMELNDDSTGDFVMNINSSVNWYFGTDGNTHPVQYDLVTVILHEITHGLGFFDGMNTDNTSGWYGINSIPMIYDTFIQNEEEKRITDTLEFENYSAELREELIGEKLYFHGPLSVNYALANSYDTISGGYLYNLGAKLYVPDKWESGSSVSHLDEQPITPQVNALMTPFIEKGEAIHDPGQFTFSILADMGWVNTRIIHDTIHSTEENLTEVHLSTLIKSDTLYNHDRVAVVYSYDQFLSSDTIFLTSPGSDDSYQTTLNIPSYNTELQYYFFVEDCFLRTYRSPSLSDSIRYKVFIGADTIKPLIEHFPVAFYLETIDSIKIEASATDNLGIDTVYIEYKVNDETSEYIGLNIEESDSYGTTLNARFLHLNGGDSVSYRIFATDTALIPNISVLPDTGYFVLDIEDIGLTRNRYTTDFTNADDDFLNFDFEITKPSGFSNYGLHSKHPYESPEDNDRSTDYTAMLRYPIVFNGSGLFINFKEIVLVEPGESGSLFGSDDFYDFVVLEVSKDFGNTWINLIDGYDSRYVSSWETAYNSTVFGNDSKYVGNESMFVSRDMFYTPDDKIIAGDTLLFRFRLYSDPFANGWGWAIEDLNINNLVDAVEEVIHEPVKVYPNPGKGLIKIDVGRSTGTGKPLPYKIFNSAGICIVDSHIAEDSETLVNISAYPTGLYIIILYPDDGIKTIKYTLIK
jgi:Secretion system C-terminal sorting domain